MLPASEGIVTGDRQTASKLSWSLPSQSPLSMDSLSEADCPRFFRTSFPPPPPPPSAFRSLRSPLPPPASRQLRSLAPAPAPLVSWFLRAPPLAPPPPSPLRLMRSLAPSAPSLLRSLAPAFSPPPPPPRSSLSRLVRSAAPDRLASRVPRPASCLFLEPFPPP